MKKTIAILTLLAAAIVGYVGHQPAPATPEAEPFVVVTSELGWQPDREEADRVAQAAPPFRIVASAEPRDHTTARVCLFDYARQVNDGKPFPTYAQEIGDCVSMGSANGVNHLAAVQIVVGMQNERIRLAFQPWLYGISRHDVGGDRIRGDGSNGSWVVQAMQKYGVLAADEPGVPAYGGAVARQWGKAPPKQWYPIAAQHLVKSYARISSAAECREAICNGYPVIICSDWGGYGRRQGGGKWTVDPCKVEDGRLVNKRQASWGHCMCVLGYDGGPKAPNGPYWFIMNSWGPKVFGDPPDDSPAGGFWVREADIEYIVRQGDSWAISGFAGFPEQDLDFRIVQRKRKADESKPRYALAF